MTIVQLRRLIADLPDDMQIVVRGRNDGYDPPMTIMVRRLAPKREPFDGILTDEGVDMVQSRSFLAFGVPGYRSVYERFNAAGIEGWFEPDDEVYCAIGWSKPELPLFALEVREASRCSHGGAGCDAMEL